MAQREEILEEDLYRAQYYRLFGRLLARAPDVGLLSLLSSLDGDASEFGNALNGVALAADRTSPESAESEYQDLFIGVGRGELLPFASFYLTGFLNEKPLARLRRDMARLGVERAEDVREPEDHIAALCEMMAGLIAGDFGDPASVARQADFFDKHIAGWADRFFEDLEAAPSANLYKAVGALGRAFMEIESTAFRMAA